MISIDIDKTYKNPVIVELFKEYKDNYINREKYQNIPPVTIIRLQGFILSQIKKSYLENLAVDKDHIFEVEYADSEKDFIKYLKKAYKKALKNKPSVLDVGSSDYMEDINKYPKASKIVCEILEREKQERNIIVVLGELAEKKCFINNEISEFIEKDLAFGNMYSDEWYKFFIEQMKKANLDINVPKEILHRCVEQGRYYHATCRLIEHMQYFEKFDLSKFLRVFNMRHNDVPTPVEDYEKNLKGKFKVIAEKDGKKYKKLLFKKAASIVYAMQVCPQEVYIATLEDIGDLGLINNYNDYEDVLKGISLTLAQDIVVSKYIEPVKHNMKPGISNLKSAIKLHGDKQYSILSRFMDDSYNQELDEMVDKIIQQLKEDVKPIVEQNHDKILRFVELLDEKQQLTKQEIEEVYYEE